MHSCTFNKINLHETRHHQEFFFQISLKTNIMQIRLQLIENKQLATSSDRIVWYSGRENAALQECRHGNVYMPMLGDFFRMRCLLNLRVHATFIEERCTWRGSSTWLDLLLVLLGRVAKKKWSQGGKKWKIRPYRDDISNHVTQEWFYVHNLCK